MTQDKYVSFYEAKELLAIKLDELSDEEFWMWCFMGNENGGLNAYISEKLDNNIKWHIANTFNWPSGESIEKYAVRAWSWFFLHSDIENFKPTKRFISGKKLLVRWKSKLGGKKKAENLIKISINKLPEINENIPSHPKISNYYPDLIGLGDDGLGGIYLLDEVIAVEKFTHMPEQETETQAEAVEDVGLVSHAGTGAKTIQPNTNELDYSGLLKEPKRKDSWFRVIDDMTRAFHSENGKMPNEHQARARLWAKPPEGYEITTGMDRGEECLRMPTERPLSKSAFTKRWTSYTQ